MTEVVTLHPALTEARTTDVGGRTFGNIPAVMQFVRGGDTPKCRALTRFFAAEYRALSGSPLSPEERERHAFRAAWDRMVWKFGVSPIGWDTMKEVPR